ncbi:MAG: RNA polymerase sigma factor [Myxococcales bacterium]|nr:RNA polymerase sigma factor [Myxococcales bacterium]
MTSPDAGAALPPVDELYARHGRSVLRRIRRFYDGQEAEEVLHEVFETLLRHGHTFRGDASPTTWLYRVTTRHCLGRLRNERRRAELFEQHGAPAWAAPVTPADQETRATLARLWNQLDPELLEIAVYHWIDGLPRDDIGAMLGVTGRTVSNRLQQLVKLARAEEGT